MTEPRIPKHPIISQSHNILLTPTEVQRVLKQIREPMAQTALTLIYCLGLRLAEGAMLRVEDLDFRNKRLRIWSGTQGNRHKYRDVCLTESALVTLGAWLQNICPTTWIFPANKGHISVAFLQNAFRCKSACNNDPLWGVIGVQN